MKEERMAILRMLENGTISADEAERLLNALQNTENKKEVSEGISKVLLKTGDVLENLAHTIGKKAGSAAKIVSEKAEEAKPEIKKAAKTVRDKVTEAAEGIREDIKNRKSGDVSEEDFEAEYTEKTDEPENEADVNETPENEACTNETPAEEEPKAEADEPAKEPESDKPEAENAPEEAPAEEEKTEAFNGFSGFSEFAPGMDMDAMAHEYEENRDYEAEFNKMMSESNGDIFGEVFNPINDILFQAQQEWEEMKNNGDGEEQ